MPVANMNGGIKAKAPADESEPRWYERGSRPRFACGRRRRPTAPTGLCGNLGRLLGRRQRLAFLVDADPATRADLRVEAAEDRGDRDALGREDVVGAELAHEADALPELQPRRARPVEVEVAAGGSTC